MNTDEFRFVDVEHNSVRLINKVTGKQFGEYFQSKCRSSEWKSALTIYEKYKRTYDVDHQELKELCKYITSFVEMRKKNGKNTSPDFMIQEVSAEFKRRYSLKNI